MDTHLTDTNAPDAGEPVEPTDQELAVCDIGRAFEQTIAKLRAELAEAREELRLYRDFYESAACGAFTGAAEERIQAHRAKPSPQSPSSADSDAPALVQEFATERLEQISADMDGPLRRKPPYETAPTLEKGVRYRVVEASPRVWPWEPGDLPIGREFVAGERDESSLNDWASIEGVLKEPGWYDIQSAQASGWHRVVRVESAPAKLAATLDRIEANQPRGKVTEADGPLFIPEPTDDGPARLVGALHDPIHPASGALIRSQPVGRAALRPGDKGYEHKPNPSITQAEPRMMGPLEDRMRRLEDAALDSDELPRVRREIRAEREGRKL